MRWDAKNDFSTEEWRTSSYSWKCTNICNLCWRSLTRPLQSHTVAVQRTLRTMQLSICTLVGFLNNADLLVFYKGRWKFWIKLNRGIMTKLTTQREATKRTTPKAHGSNYSIDNGTPFEACFNPEPRNAIAPPSQPPPVAIKFSSKSRLSKGISYVLMYQNDQFIF